jgi:predicted SAM-dependent methyltransferase
MRVVIGAGKTTLDGRTGRSLRFDTRNKDGTLGMVSIVLDAKKTGRMTAP